MASARRGERTVVFRALLYEVSLLSTLSRSVPCAIVTCGKSAVLDDVMRWLIFRGCTSMCLIAPSSMCTRNPALKSFRFSSSGK